MAHIVELPKDVWAKRKQEALAVLGGTMAKMPVRFWEENMLFKGVQNTWWRLKTSGFPATDFTSGTHPLFVLRKKGNQGLLICPCSSKGGKSRYIKKGCVLLHTDEHIDRNSFLVERFAFSLPVTATFSPQPNFHGKVPGSCITEVRS